MKISKGFTLIELIVVIIILGVLSTVALPRFVGLDTEARTAAVEALAGAVRSANNLVTSSALVKGFNANISSYPTGATNPGGSASIRLWCSHPDSQWDGIGNALQGASVTWGTGYNSNNSYPYGNFTFKRNGATNTVSWEYTSAPTPSACKVNYKYNPGWPNCGTGTGNLPTITTIVSGC
jgi:MSHA pilin protein MshA